MSAAARKPAGDPALEGDSRITREPVVEDERSELAQPERLRRPATWAIVAGVVALIALAIVAGAAAGWAYTIPFAVVVLLGLVAIALHRGAGAANRRAEGEAPVPDASFDARG